MKTRKRGGGYFGHCWKYNSDPKRCKYSPLALLSRTLGKPRLSGKDVVLTESEANITKKTLDEALNKINRLEEENRKLKEENKILKENTGEKDNDVTNLMAALQSDAPNVNSNNALIKNIFKIFQDLRNKLNSSIESNKTINEAAQRVGKEAYDAEIARANAANAELLRRIEGGTATSQGELETMRQQLEIEKAKSAGLIQEKMTITAESSSTISRLEADLAEIKAQLELEKTLAVQKGQSEANYESDLGTLLEAVQGHNENPDFKSSNGLMGEIVKIFRELKADHTAIETEQRSNCDAAKEKLREETERRIADLRAQNDVLSAQDKSGALSEITRQKTDLDQRMAADAAAHAAELAELQQEKNALETKQAELNATISAQEVAFQQACDSQKQKQTENLDTEIKALTDAIQGHGQLDTSVVKSGLLQSLYGIFKRLGDEYARAKTENEAQKTTLRQDLEAKQREFTELQKQKAGKDHADTELLRKNQECTQQFEAYKQKCEAEKDGLQQTRTRLDEERARILAENAALNAQLQSHKTKAASCDAEKAENAILKTELQKKTGELAAIGARVQKLEKDVLKQTQERNQKSAELRRVNASREAEKQLKQQASAERRRAESEKRKIPVKVTNEEKVAFARSLGNLYTDEIEKKLLPELYSQAFNDLKLDTMQAIKALLVTKIAENQACIQLDQSTVAITEKMERDMEAMQSLDNKNFQLLDKMMQELIDEITELSGGVGQIFLKISPSSSTSTSKRVFVERKPDGRTPDGKIQDNKNYAQYYKFQDGKYEGPIDAGYDKVQTGLVKLTEFRSIFTNKTGEGKDTVFKKYFLAEMERYMLRISQDRPTIMPIFIAFGQSGSGKSWSLCGNANDKNKESILDTVYNSLSKPTISNKKYSIKQYYCHFKDKRNHEDEGKFYYVKKIPQHKWADKTKPEKIYLSTVDTKHGTFDKDANGRNVIELKVIEEMGSVDFNPRRKGDDPAIKEAEYGVNNALDLVELRDRYDYGRIERGMSALNKFSSRSHIFIDISFDYTNPTTRKVSNHQITIIDLAGNEGVYQKKRGVGTANIIDQEMNMIKKTLTYVKTAVQAKRTFNREPQQEKSKRKIAYDNFIEEINERFFRVPSKIYFLFTIRGFYGNDDLQNDLIFNTGVGDPLLAEADKNLVTFPFARDLIASETASCAATGGKEIRTSARPTRRRKRRCWTRRKNNRRSSLLSKKVS
jgi:hypothetical protein